LGFQRGLYAHKFYQRALRAAVPLLISLADAGAGAADALTYRSEEDIMRVKEDADREFSYAGMSAQQKKKAKEKVAHAHTHARTPQPLLPSFATSGQLRNIY
jgi:hypothetical protein